MAATGEVLITDLSGGMNTFDAPIVIPDDQCQSAVNVDFWDAQLGSKRLGASSVTITFSAGGPFSGSIGSLIRHVPADDETVAELWAIDGNAVNRFARMAGASTFAEATLKDNLSAAASAFNVVGASLNGFLWLCYKSAGGNYLHVWDPSLSKVRRVGISTPNVPTTAEDGAGALSFTRFYRVRDVDVSGSDVRRISEASTTATRTIAAKAGITVTKGAATGEDETHWDLEAADTAAGPWYRIARTIIGTTTFDDTNATIPTTNPSAVDGINTPPPSAKFIVATDARLILASAWETSGGYTKPKNNRVWFTPVIGDNDIGDLERIPTGRYLDVDAAITGLSQPINGTFYVFSYRKIWRFVPTEDATAPYVRYTVSTTVGCIRHQTIVAAEDEQGNPCIYFLSHRGPYRIGPNGLQFVGMDVMDMWAQMDLSGGGYNTLYYPDKHQVWFYINTSGTSALFTDTKMVFDVRMGRPSTGNSVRRGWVMHTGDSAANYASLMFSNTLGATMSRDLKPYVAQSGGASARLWKADVVGSYQDGTTTYLSQTITKEYMPLGARQNMSISKPSIIWQRPLGSGIFTIDIGVYPDFAGTLSSASGSTQTITTAKSVLQIDHQKADGLQLAGAGSFSVRIGDQAGSASINSFSVFEIVVPYTAGELR